MVTVPTGALYALVGYTASISFELLLFYSYGDILRDMPWFMGLQIIKAMYDKSFLVYLALKRPVLTARVDTPFSVMRKLVDEGNGIPIYQLS